MAIVKIKGQKKRADIDAINNLIVQADATNIDKNTIKDSATQIVAQKLVIKKNTSQVESYHQIATEEDLRQAPRHSIIPPTKENFNKTTEVESGTQTNFIHNNIYVKNDVFEAFYEDCLEYKGYVNDIFNTLIPKDDILHRTEKENTTEHCQKIKSLQNQTEDLKKENEVLKEILTSKFDFNENNVSNNNIDKTWKTVKTSRNNTVNNKVNNRRFNSIDDSNKYHPISIHENEVTEPRINNRTNARRNVTAI